MDYDEWEQLTGERANSDTTQQEKQELKTARYHTIANLFDSGGFISEESEVDYTESDIDRMLLEVDMNLKLNESESEVSLLQSLLNLSVKREEK